MNFLRRATMGLLLMCLTLGLVLVAGWRLTASFTHEKDGSRPGARERSYTVDAKSIVPTSYTPMFDAYGEIRAWRTLELRAPTSGTVMDLTERFRDGASVKAGDVLFRIDTRSVQSGVATSKVQLAQTQSDLAQAQATAELVTAELSTAKRQLDIAKRELKRQGQLREKGLVSEGAVENAELAVANALQTVSSRQQSQLASRMRVDTAKLALDKAEIELGDATTGLNEATVVAPFDGQLSDINVGLGRRVNNNEKLGLLIDNRLLEVAFQVRDQAFARLIDSEDATRLLPLPVQVTLRLGDRDVTLNGTLDRAAATVDSRQGGRTVFARLNNETGSAARPGDFVEVTVTEPTMEQVSVVPSHAITEDGRLFTVDDDNRLVETQVSVLRRQGQDVIVTGIDPAQRIVLNRLPQLANGILVAVRDDETKPGDGSTDQQTLVELSDERRQKLVESVENNTFIPNERRKKILERLRQPKVPRRMVERIESRMKG